MVTMIKASAFITGLAAALAGDQLRERVLLAPSYRVGRQWLDQAAALAGGVANVRAVTIKRLLLDLAEPELRRRGARPATKAEAVGLVGFGLAEAAAGGEGYFTKLPVNQVLAGAILASLEEVEAAVTNPVAAVRHSVSSPEKARELTRLLRLVGEGRRRAGYAGPAEIRSAALAALGADGYAPPHLLVPASLREDMTASERELVRRWPTAALTIIPEDAGLPRADMAFFVADHIQDEAREVFRRIQASGVALDEVEVVCTAPDEYGRALCAAAIEAFGGPPEDTPVTFSGGLPGEYSRPVRQLVAWP